MASNNPFEVHGISHLSASNINLFVTDKAKWIAQYLFKMRDETSPSAIRGNVLEHCLNLIKSNNDEIRSGSKYVEHHVLHKKFNMDCVAEGFDLDDEKVQKEADKLFKYFENMNYCFADCKKFNQYQQKIFLNIWDLPVPFIGYTDFITNDEVIDLKTTLRMPSEPSEGHKRQLAMYQMAYQDKNCSLYYVSPTKYRKFRHSKRELQYYSEQTKQICFAIQKFLSISNDKEELASLVYPDYDSWMWSENFKLKAKEIWR